MCVRVCVFARACVCVCVYVRVNGIVYLFCKRVACTFSCKVNKHGEGQKVVFIVLWLDFSSSSITKGILVNKTLLHTLS